MTLPQFVSNKKLADHTSTTTQSIVRSYNNLVANLSDIFTSSQKKVQSDSVLLENKVISGPTIIQHTLGRTLTGWQVIRQSAPALIWDNQTTASDPRTFLYLDSTAKVTVSLLVF